MVIWFPDVSSQVVFYSKLWHGWAGTALGIGMVLAVGIPLIENKYKRQMFKNKHKTQMYKFLQLQLRNDDLRILFSNDIDPIFRNISDGFSRLLGTRLIQQLGNHMPKNTKWEYDVMVHISLSPKIKNK